MLGRQGIVVITVRENRNKMRNDLEGLGFGDGKSLSSNVDNLKLGDMFVSDEHGEGVITQLTNSLLLVEFGNYMGAYYKDTMTNISNRKDILTKKPNTIEKEMKCQ